MPFLSLAHFTVVEADPITLIEAAQAGGYDAIGLRIVPPFPTDHVFPVIGNPNLARSIKRRLMEIFERQLDISYPIVRIQVDRFVKLLDRFIIAPRYQKVGAKIGRDDDR